MGFFIFICFIFVSVQLGAYAFLVKSKIKKGLFAIALIVYIYGFFLTYDSENLIRILWVVVAPFVFGLVTGLSKKDFK